MVDVLGRVLYIQCVVHLDNARYTHTNPSHLPAGPDQQASRQSFSSDLTMRDNFERSLLDQSALKSRAQSGRVVILDGQYGLSVVQVSDG